MLSKIITALGWLQLIVLGLLQSIGIEQPDKVLHFIGGAIIAAAMCIATGSMLAAVWLALAVAYAKERYDKAHADRHTWDGWDAFATVLGGLAAVTVDAYFSNWV